MTGKYDIELYNATVHYFLTVKRNITVLQGNSASGKSELVRLLMDFGRSGESSGITLICEKPCTVLTAEDWELRLAHMSGRIVFIDEGSSFVKTEEFARAIMGSDNYFVIINRDSLYELPYSIHEIYGLREADHSRYKNAEQVYNEMYQLYTSFPDPVFEAEHIITEDSGSGFQFFSKAFPNQVSTAGGKGNVLKCLQETAGTNQKTVAIVDGAAFGPEMSKVYEWLEWQPDHAIFAPESFEYLILASGVDNAPNAIVERTYDFADSCQYMSWEQFYTDYLIQLTARRNHPYQKRKLAGFYLTKGNLGKILRQLPPGLKIVQGSKKD